MSWFNSGDSGLREWERAEAQRLASETALRVRAGITRNETEFNSEHRLRAENLAFDIDVWYPRLKEITFESVFLPLDRCDAAAIVRSYDVLWRKKSDVQFTRVDVEILRKLQRRIDEVLSTAPFASADGADPPAAFLRLCGRSPKDGEPRDRRRVWSEYLQNYEAVKQEVVRLLTDGEDDLSSHQLKAIKSEGNVKLVAISRTPTLRVESGADAMALLLSSERVYLDMIDWLKYGEPEQIVLRRWEPKMKLEYEFRAFVWQNRMTALSQYDHYAVYPHLEPQRQRILTACYASWQQEVHQRIGIESYCADFIYLPDQERAVLIEVSPFLPCTGPALFSWTKDFAILTSPSGPADCNGVTFRLGEHVRHQIDDLVEMTWEDRWLNQRIPAHDTLWSNTSEGRFPQGGVIAAAVAPAGALAVVFLHRIHLLTALLRPEVAALSVPLAAAASAAVYWKGRERAPSRHHTIFVYGTLRRGYFWHSKFLHGASFLGHARTVDPEHLVIGRCGVPYMLGGEDLSSELALRVTGELYAVEPAALEGMDGYEGVTKGHYARQRCRVALTDGTRREAWVYKKIVQTGTSADLLSRPRISEYTKQMQDDLYRPIHHILVKQLSYLCDNASPDGSGNPFSSWGLAPIEMSRLYLEHTKD